MKKPRILVLADDCNPQWPSLPIVGYKYARALGHTAEMTLVTHVRNRANIEAAGDMTGPVHYVDNEWLAGPMYRLATKLRGGNEVAWSTNQIMAYLPYLEFERQAWSAFGPDLKAGRFDIVHRITPMTPTLPSWIAGRGKASFVIGPLNGNLDWPSAFAEEQRREREGLRKLRNLYKVLPYSRRTFREASAVLVAFDHTARDLADRAEPAKMVPLPEIGYDPAIFHPGGRRPAFSGSGPKRFLYAGRLVPYKVPEIALLAFIHSDILRPHTFHIVGEGPELARLQALVSKAGAADRIIFEGPKPQAEVADFMRDCDAFVFPSIRELGAGVVIEAMACGILCMVTNYGAPGDLVAQGRGLSVDLTDRETMVIRYRAAMERVVAAPPAEIEAMTGCATAYASQLYDWKQKADYTSRIYQAVLEGEPLDRFKDYL